MKDSLLESSLKFLDRHGRLPYLSEDKAEFIDDGEVKQLSVAPRIKNEFGSYRKFFDWLIEKGHISTSDIAELVNDTPTRVENIMSKSVKNPDRELRISIDRVVGIDFYEKELTKYNEQCVKCKKSCKQSYKVDVFCRKRQPK